MDNLKKAFGISLKGAGMGIAEVIPGVSGGTIAFITGIYSELIDSIAAINIQNLRLLFRGDFKGFWKAINGSFLMSLGLGMILGVLFGIFFISFMIDQYPELLWAFFFGLIIASIFYLINQAGQFTVGKWSAFAIGALLAYAATAIYPIQGSTNLIYVFISGVIAICALILPGISGSFLLLIMGMYTIIIPTLKELITNPTADSFQIFIVFALGCLVGLLSFAKVLKYTFQHFPNYTIAVMSGFMLGSIHKIWPWRNPVLAIDKESGKTLDIAEHSNLSQLLSNEHIEIILDKNVFPHQYYGEPRFYLVLFSFILAMLLVFLLSRKK